MIYTKVRRFELARRVALLELLIVALMAGRSHAAVLPVPDTLTTRGSLKVSGTDHKATLLQNNQVQLAAGANFTMIAGAAYTPVGVASSSARQPLRIDTTSEGYRCSGGVCSFPNGNVGASYSAP